MKKEYFLIMSFIFLLLAGQEAGMALEGDVTMDTTDTEYETAQDAAETFVYECPTWRRIVCIETPYMVS
ncbi:hypothetical protein KKA03_04365 [archaeon]|nr:hypothetical protein [archaeon]